MKSTITIVFDLLNELDIVNQQITKLLSNYDSSQLLCHKLLLDHRSKIKLEILEYVEYKIKD